MNRSGFNSSGFNASALALGLVFAAAVLTGGAAVSGAAIRGVDALAPSSSGAHLVASATAIRTANADLTCLGMLHGSATHTHACGSSFEGQASIVAAVLRMVEGYASVPGSANIEAIVASQLGASNALCGVAVNAQATRIQAAFGSLVGNAPVVVSLEPVVTRFVVAEDVRGQASLRAETCINGVHETYAGIVGSSNITLIDDGAVTRNGISNFTGNVYCQSTATKIQPGNAELLGTSLLEPPEVYVVNSAQADLVCNGQVTAIAVRVVVPTALLISSCNMQAAPVQEHSASGVIEAVATITDSAVITRFNSSLLVVSAQIQANAQRTTYSAANIDCGVYVNDSSTKYSALVFSGANLLSVSNVTVNAERITYSEANIDCGVLVSDSSTKYSALVPAAVNLVIFSDITANATRNLIAQANINAGIELQGIAQQVSVLVPAAADFSGTVVLVVDAVKLLTGFAVITGSAVMYSDTIANPESIDPFERTFYRPKLQTEFIR